MTFGSRHLSRRHFLCVLGATVAAPRGAFGAAGSATLEILVDRDDWGAASTADIRAVLVSAASEVWQHCGSGRLKPIRVYHRADHPQTDFLHDWRGRIRIGLAVENGRWAQLAFQFGHEFCHALAQHSEPARRGWHALQHANLWLEESLCETASLFVLRRMAETWRTQPPRPEWRGDAPALAAYATERLARPEHRLPAGQRFADWFRENESALRADAALRAKNVIIATQLLPLFDSEPAGWEAACFLNLGTRDLQKPLARQLTEWQANSPADLRPFVRRIGAALGM